MNFLELAGNLEEEDDLEILKEPPVRVNMSMTAPDKGKETSIVPVKRKAGSNVAGPEKLMADALKTRSSKRLAKIEIIEGKEIGKKAESGISVRTNRAFGPNWSLNEETMLLTPDERTEWMEHALPPCTKTDSKSCKAKK